ncbi:MAG: DUF58 domain-containing protein [Candidatus Eremiobacteraeota bacterium]|nr:DUF58 domain-containing protein [Candidatus Eremiobacteraeota bacterium]
MERASRIDLTLAPPAGLAAFALSFVVLALAGTAHPALRALVVFAGAFPLLWVALATTISYAAARALRAAGAELPAHTRALSTFRLGFTLANVGRLFPAIGVLTKARISAAGVALDVGPWAEIPMLGVGRATTTHWQVMAKQRGTLLVGPFRAAVELPGSAIRATALFDRVYAVNVLPAVYQLHPFVEALLAGRHVAGARFQMLPAAIEEYVGSREYRPGDSPKTIHRVLSLRAPDPNQFFVREFRDPSRDDLSVVLDTAPPLDGNEELHRYRFEKAIAFVSALCRAFAARRLTVRFVCQRGKHDLLSLRVRPLDADLDRLDRELAHVGLRGDRATVVRALLGEVRRHGAAVIFVSLRSREALEQQRLSMVTLTPDHVPVFTREVVGA